VILGDGVGATSGEIALSTLPERLLADVLPGEVCDDLLRPSRLSRVLHLRGSLHRPDGDAGDELAIPKRGDKNSSDLM